MQKIIISDTSCLITLDKINQLETLRSLFRTITVSTIIAEEYGKSLPAFVEILDPSQKVFQQTLQLNVDAGEASAIALALQYKDSLIIIDDFKARKIAEGLGLNITGTLGV